MRKVIVLVLALLLVGGCAGFGKWSAGAQAVIDSMCNPTDAQKAEADKWLTMLDSVQDRVAQYFPPIAIVKASSAMTVLKNGGCFVLADIEAALTLISDMETKQAEATKGIKAPPFSVKDEFPALYAAVLKK